MASRRGPPNILIVALDCVRASDFPGGSPGLGAMPFCETLRKESIVFPRATSPAPWTIPSHASIFSGLAPWETGCHWKGNLKLPSSVPRVPEILHREGYRTMSLAANPLIQPTFGLVDGFDQAAWAGWWEPFVRFKTRRPPNMVPARSGGKKGVLSRVRVGPINRLVTESRAIFVRRPFTLEAGSQFAQHLFGDNGGGNRWMARWIEPTFRDWVSNTPANTPVYAFINLLDAHEPYFLRPSSGPALASWLDFATTRQDTISWLTGKVTPSSANLELIHGLYRQMIQGMDARIGALVETLRATGRWDNTVMVLTSDHGQAFGEHGMVFHMLRVDEQLIRIPLWLRLPGGEQGGTTAKGWANLVDLAPTALGLADVPYTNYPSAVPLTSLVDQERFQPAVAISDGIIWQHFRNKFNAERTRAIDRVFATAYRGDRKVVVDTVTNAISAYDVVQDPSESRDLWSSESESLRPLAEAAALAGRQTTSATAAELTPDVEDRLKAWGYI